MSQALDKIKELIAVHKKKTPAYESILSFFEKIAAEQESSRSRISVPPPALDMDIKLSQMKEGFPLLEKQDFVIDVDSSKDLFESICKIARNQNDKLGKNIQAIEEAVSINALNIIELLRRFYDDSFILKIAGDFDIDAAVLKFLAIESIRPSLAVHVQKLGARIDLNNWLRGYCPVCGSLPQISFLKDEGRRFFRCSLCTFEWPSERLKCPFCETRDHKNLHYFYAEGDESYRVDVCENCHQYIKTVDLRKLGYEPDLAIEDIVTIHLDIIAAERGYNRPSPGFWGI